ncbi:nickel pincer cofactor biosynthesis protein LarB [bacterium]|nr:nickel pincer cofactor biosynthesis protein LarB [bacterium]
MTDSSRLEGKHTVPNSEELKTLLLAIQSGKVGVDAGLEQLRSTGDYSLSESDDLCLDTGRASRCGLPEVVYAPGKSANALSRAFETLQDIGQPCLATRVSREQSIALQKRFPEVITNELARTVRLPAPDGNETSPASSSGRVFVLSAGTSDRPVAEEALETLCWANCDVELILDIGVAGPQRLLRHVNRLRTAAAIVVVAGMEGALPSVVAGHVGCPVFAVPTSVGYGAAFGGVAALLSMLNSCAANVAVVNIDAGFKAGYLAALVARQS